MRDSTRPTAGSPQPPAARPSSPGRRTNAALLVSVVSATATGVLAFALGTEPAATLVAVAHAAAGLALVLLVPWKRVVARRGLRRGPHAGRPAGIALAVLLAVTVLAGVVQAVAGYGRIARLAPLQVHVGAAVLALPLLAWHAGSHRRRQRLRAADLDRRTLLRAAVLTAGSLVSWLALDRATAGLRLPGARDRATGSTEVGSFNPPAMPVTQWFTDIVPTAARARPGATVRVAAAGRHTEVEVAGDDEVTAVLDCTGGWYSEQRWRGIRMDRLLAQALAGGVPTGALSVEVVSVTGYRRRLPLSDAAGLLLATHVGGRPLSPGHGAPLRLVAPGRRGFWWVKWVERVEVVDDPSWTQPPFPLQ